MQSFKIILLLVERSVEIQWAVFFFKFHFLSLSRFFFYRSPPPFATLDCGTLKQQNKLGIYGSKGTELVEQCYNFFLHLATATFFCSIPTHTC